jgi:hypothetical protein
MIIWVNWSERWNGKRIIEGVFLQRNSILSSTLWGILLEMFILFACLFWKSNFHYIIFLRSLSIICDAIIKMFSPMFVFLTSWLLNSKRYEREEALICFVPFEIMPTLLQLMMVKISSGFVQSANSFLPSHSKSNKNLSYSFPSVEMRWYKSYNFWFY